MLQVVLTHPLPLSSPLGRAWLLHHAVPGADAGRSGPSSPGVYPLGYPASAKQPCKLCCFPDRAERGPGREGGGDQPRCSWLSPACSRLSCALLRPGTGTEEALSSLHSTRGESGAV